MDGSSGAADVVTGVSPDMANGTHGHPSKPGIADANAGSKTRSASLPSNAVGLVQPLRRPFFTGVAGHRRSDRRVRSWNIGGSGRRSGRSRVAHGLVAIGPVTQRQTDDVEGRADRQDLPEIH